MKLDLPKPTILKLIPLEGHSPLPLIKTSTHKQEMLFRNQVPQFIFISLQLHPSIELVSYLFSSEWGCMDRNLPGAVSAAQKQSSNPENSSITTCIIPKTLQYKYYIKLKLKLAVLIILH